MDRILESYHGLHEGGLILGLGGLFFLRILSGQGY